MRPFLSHLYICPNLCVVGSALFPGPDVQDEKIELIQFTYEHEFFCGHPIYSATVGECMYVCAQLLNYVQLFCNPKDCIALQAALSMEFPRQEYWSRLPFPIAGDLPDPGNKSTSLVSPALAGRFFTTAPLEKP